MKVKRHRLVRFCFVVGPNIQQNDGRLTMSDFGLKLMKYPTSFFSEKTLLAPQTKADVEGQQIDAVFPGIRIVPLPNPGNRLLRWIRQAPVIWRAISDADLVCANIPEEASFLAAVICRIRRKSFMLQVLGDWGRAVELDGPPGLMRDLKVVTAEWMTVFAVRAAKLVSTQGEHLRQKYLRQNPSAFRSSFVHSTLREETFFEEKLRPFHEPFRILVVSRLAKGKGLELLLEAMAAIRVSGVSAELWCVGDGPLGPKLAEMAQALGVSANIRFTGFLDTSALSDMYRDADVFVLPSLAEGVPNVILEAMAQSLPVIVTAVGGIPYVLKHEVDSLLIRPGSSSEIVDAIMRLKNDQALADELRVAGFKRSQDFLTSNREPEIKKMIEDAFGSISDRDQDDAAEIVSRIENRD